jgi:hypothetical protein
VVAVLASILYPGMWMWWLCWPTPYSQGGDCGGYVGQHQIVSEMHSMGIDTIWMWWLCWPAPYIQGGRCGGCVG